MAWCCFSLKKAVSLDIECRILPWFYLQRRRFLLLRSKLQFIPKFALYISRPFLHVDHCVNSVNINFTLNLTQGVFIDRIYRINRTETSNFNAPTLVTNTSHKTTAKCGILCTKTLLFNGERTPRHTFLCSDPQCLPPGDPIILCAKHASPIT